MLLIYGVGRVMGPKYIVSMLVFDNLLKYDISSVFRCLHEPHHYTSVGKINWIDGCTVIK